MGEKSSPFRSGRRHEPAHGGASVKHYNFVGTMSTIFYEVMKNEKRKQHAKLGRKRKRNFEVLERE